MSTEEKITNQNLSSTVTSKQTQLNPLTSRYKFRLVLSIVVAIISVFAIFFLIYQNYQLKKQLPTPEAPQAQSPITSPEPVAEEPNPTANWKTYEYSNFGYSFMLPKTYIVSENQLIPTSPLTIQSLSLNETNASQGPNDIGIFVVNSRLEDRLTEMKRDNFEKVNNVKIVKGTTWTIAYNYTFGETQYLNYHNGKTYILGGRNTGFLDQVLSTFKFVGQSGDQNIDDILNKIKMTDSTIRWGAVTTTDTFRYPVQNGTDLPVQKISFTATGKEDFNKANKIVNVLKGDGWELDNNGSASGVGVSYESYVKNIKGVNYLLVFGFNNSNTWFAMSKI